MHFNFINFFKDVTAIPSRKNKNDLRMLDGVTNKISR